MQKGLFYIHGNAVLLRLRYSAENLEPYCEIIEIKGEYV